jgi:hypothetical protein
METPPSEKNNPEKEFNEAYAKLKNMAESGDGHAKELVKNYESLQAVIETLRNMVNYEIMIFKKTVNFPNPMSFLYRKLFEHVRSTQNLIIVYVKEKTNNDS